MCENREKCVKMGCFTPKKTQNRASEPFTSVFPREIRLLGRGKNRLVLYSGNVGTFLPEFTNKIGTLAPGGFGGC